jgi:hypothetical protein
VDDFNVIFILGKIKLPEKEGFKSMECSEKKTRFRWSHKAK